MYTASVLETGQDGKVLNVDYASNGYKKGYEDYVVNREMVLNELTWRRKMQSMFLDPRRNIEKECGYPDDSELNAQKFKDLYDREPIAAKVVNIYPNACWSTPPEIYETDDLDITTPFEQAWEDMGKRLRGPGFFNCEKNNPVFEYLKRADVLSGIGHYGVIFLGFDDITKEGSVKLEDPVDFVETGEEEEDDGHKNITPGVDQYRGDWDVRHPYAYSSDTPDVKVQNLAPYAPSTPKAEAKEPDVEGIADVSTEETPAPKKYTPKRRLLFIRVLDETQAPVATYDVNPASVRYGLPEYYNVQVNEAYPTTSGASISGTSTGSVKVHWTRIVHVAEIGTTSSECIANPRMKVLYNRLYDLHKLYGGSAEMYWKGAFFGISMETHPQLGGDVKIDWAAVRGQVDKWQEGLDRTFGTTGMTIKTLAPTVVDPSPQIDKQIEAICIQLDCPKRVFMGSEIGQLSSDQNARYWYGRVKDRQHNYVTPRIVVAFIDRLIQVGTLPVPEEGYYVYWEDVANLTDAERADVALKETQALAAYVAGEVNVFIDEVDYMVHVLRWPKDTAQQIIESKMEKLEEEGGGLLDAKAEEDKEMEMEAMKAEQEFAMAQGDKQMEFQSKEGGEQRKFEEKITKAKIGAAKKAPIKK